MFTKIKRFPLMILTSSFVILMATIWSQKSLAESATAVDSCIPPPADIISWWPGDGNANDIRGGYDGTLINGASFASGKVGQAFSFDGVDDGVIVPNPSMLNFGVGADFSLTAWIRITPNAPNPPSNQFTILSKRYAPSIDADPTGFELFVLNGRLGLQLADDSMADSSYQNFFASEPELDDGNFHHVAATIDRDSRTVVSLYVDGVLNSSFQTSAELGDLSTTEPLRIAVHATDGFDAFFDGIIDEVTIFNRALSPSEINAIYSAGSAGKCKAYAIFLPLVITPCDARYMDDFSNVGSDWPTGNDDVRQLEYVGGEYRMLVKSADSWVAVRPGIKGTNMRVSVDVRNANGKDGIYGIVFGLADDWSQFYTLQIGADGYYGLWQNDGSWTLLELGFSNAIKTGTTTNHIKIERIGSQINLYANGQMLLTTTNNAYTGLRHVGLITSSFDQENQDVRFDNFDVCSLSGSFATTYQPLLMQSDFP